MKKSIVNIPKKHHYIPQFLIRNFLSSDGVFVRYYDIKIGSFFNKYPEEIFVYNDLYRDKSNRIDQVQIERDFAKYEGEMSILFNNRLLKENELLLSKKEIDSLLLFIALTPFRSKSAYQQFGKKISKESKDYFSKFQKNGDIEAFWRRNLKYLVNCRSLEEVLNNANIDEPIKLFMARDVFGGLGFYPIIVERRGGEDFFLSDVTNALIDGIGNNGVPFTIMRFFPISPKRMLILAQSGIENARQEIRVFREEIFRRPQLMSNSLYRLAVKKIYENDVRFINDTIFKYVKEGAAVANEKAFKANNRIK